MEEEEAKILDYILSELIKKDCLRSRDLKPLDKGFLANNEDVKESVYKQYFSTLKINGIVRLEDGINNRTEIYAIPNKTKNFLKNGGFIAKFELENKESKRSLEIEELNYSKLKSDTRISKWQVRTFWPIFIFGLVGFILGVVNFLDQRNYKKETDELQQRNRIIQRDIIDLRKIVSEQKKDTIHK